MLVRYTQISQASGSAGGLTAARNRGGNYLRKRIKPVNPNSPAQNEARQNLAAAAAAWRGLTDAQRISWNNYAATTPVSNKLGEEVKLSGIDWYTRVNTLRLLDNNTQVATAPTELGSAVFSGAETFVLDASTGDLTFTVDPTDPWASNDDGRLFVFITPGQSPGRYSPVNAYRFVEAFPGDTLTPVNEVGVSIANGISVIAGRVYFVRLRVLDQLNRVSRDSVYRVVAQA